jgi:hypothetical protein
MKSILSLILLLTTFYSCTQPEGFKEPEDSIDAGREFVRAVLDGDYEKANLYILENEEDKALFERYKTYTKKQPRKEKLQLKSASIIINKVEKINDSTSIINYSNSYSMTPMDLKVMLSDKKWRVDFSYTFSGNTSIK